MYPILASKAHAGFELCIFCQERNSYREGFLIFGKIDAPSGKLPTVFVLLPENTQHGKSALERVYSKTSNNRFRKCPFLGIVTLGHCVQCPDPALFTAFKVNKKDIHDATSSGLRYFLCFVLVFLKHYITLRGRV